MCWHNTNFTFEVCNWRLKTEGTVIEELEELVSESFVIVIVIAILLPEVAVVGEVWEASGEEAHVELCEEGREEHQCEVKSNRAKDTGQVVDEEGEVGEQDLAWQGVGWGERGGDMIRLVCGWVWFKRLHWSNTPKHANM